MPRYKPTDTYSPEYGPDNPDTRPGDYFVSVWNDAQFGLLLGPYPTHAEALERVGPTSTLAEQYDSFAHFYVYGTCRLEPGSGVTGTLNDLIGGVEQ